MLALAERNWEAGRKGSPRSGGGHDDRRFAAVAFVFTCAARWPASAFQAATESSSSSALVLPASAIRTSRSTATAATTSSTTLLDLAYDPATDVLTGVATITARATQNLSSFNLDFDGLDGPLDHGRRARRRDWSRDGGELTVTPTRGCASATASRRSSPTTACRRRSDRSSAARASSTPTTARSSSASRTSRRPGSRSTTTRSTRRPTRSASRSRRGSRRCRTACSRASAPATAGRPGPGTRRSRWRRTWRWRRSASSTSRLPRRTASATGTRSTRTCSTPTAPRTGEQFALSQAADPSYKRLTRTITVPPAARAVVLGHARHRARLGLHLRRGAHGRRRRLDDAARRSTATPARTPASSCPFWLELASRSSRTTRPTTATAPARRAAPPASGGRRPARATATSSGRSTCPRTPARTSRSRSATPATTSCRAPASFVDDIAVSTGEGTTSFEDDGDALDGWTVPGAPAGSAPNANDWIVGTAADAPATARRDRRGVVRPPAGDHRLPRGLLRAVPVLGRRRHRRRLERARLRAGEPDPADLRAGLLRPTRVAATASSCTSWPTSGSATAWPSRRGSTSGSTRASRPTPSGCGASTRASARRRRSSTSTPASPPTTRSGALTIGDPGPEQLFDVAVYYRGAMTLQALRLTVGDEDFFRILRRWVRQHAGGNVTTTSSSPSRSASPASSSTSCSRRGCSRRRSRWDRDPPAAGVARGGSPRRQAAQRDAKGAQALSGAATFRRPASPAPRTPPPRACVRGAG